MENKQKYIISLSNELNTMIWERGEMTLQAIRLVFLYLALINPLTPEITEVTIPLYKYASELHVELNECALEKSCQLLREYQFKFGGTIDGIPTSSCKFFAICQLAHRKSDGMFVLELKCSDEIKRHIFDLSKNYTHFSASNVFSLRDLRAIRLYMLLAQYRVIKRRTIPLTELKQYLGIDVDAYTKYKFFSHDVLKVCQNKLQKNTDIVFSYRAIGSPAQSIVFEISENESQYMWQVF